MLSDPKVIEAINRDFIAVELNLTGKKVPDLPALFGERLVYGSGVFNTGYVSSTIISSDGKKRFADAGSSNWWEVHTAINYNPDRYLNFLGDGLARHKAAAKTRSK